MYRCSGRRRLLASTRRGRRRARHARQSARSRASRNSAGTLRAHAPLPAFAKRRIHRLDAGREDHDRTRFGNTRSFHRRSAIGARRQITFFDEPVTAATGRQRARARASPTSRDVGGDENYQVDSSIPRARIRSGSPTAADAPAAASGRMTARATRSLGQCGPAVNTDIYLEDPLDRRLRRWCSRPGDRLGRHRLVARRQVAAARTFRFRQRELAARLRPRNATAARDRAGEGQGGARGGSFTPDGKGVYFTSDLGSEFLTLRYTDLATGKVTAFTDHLNSDIDDFTCRATATLSRLRRE